MNEELIESRIRELEDQVDTIIATLTRIEKLLDKFEGAGTLVKILFFIVAPIVGAITWAKDHIKL